MNQSLTCILVCRVVLLLHQPMHPMHPSCNSGYFQRPLLEVESSDRANSRVVRATLTQHNTAEFLLQLVNLDSRGKAAGMCERWVEAMRLHSRQRPLFSISPADERGRAGSTAANEKGDAGGDGGGQRPAEAGRAGDAILLVLLPSQFSLKPFHTVFICAPSFLCGSPCFCSARTYTIHTLCGETHCWKFKMLHSAARTQPTTRAHEIMHAVAGQRNHSGFWWCSRKCNW